MMNLDPVMQDGKYALINFHFEAYFAGNVQTGNQVNYYNSNNNPLP